MYIAVDVYATKATFLRTKKKHKSEELPTYKLTLSDLAAIDLYNAGSWLDKQDPMMEIKIGKNIYKTARQHDAGTDVQFPEVFECNIVQEMYDKGELNIEVEMFNQSKLGGRSHIGKGKVDLKQAVPCVDNGEPFLVEIDLIHTSLIRGDSNKGKVKMHALLLSPPEPQLDEDQYEEESVSMDLMSEQQSTIHTYLLQPHEGNPRSNPDFNP